MLLKWPIHSRTMSYNVSRPITGHYKASWPATKPHKRLYKGWTLIMPKWNFQHTDKHRYTEGPCWDYRQVQIDTDRLRGLEVWCGAHNLLELRGRVCKQIIIQIQIETVIYKHHMIGWWDSNSSGRDWPCQLALDRDPRNHIHQLQSGSANVAKWWILFGFWTIHGMQLHPLFIMIDYFRFYTGFW